MRARTIAAGATNLLFAFISITLKEFEKPYFIAAGEVKTIFTTARARCDVGRSALRHLDRCAGYRAAG